MSRLEAYLDIRERKCNFFQYFNLHFLRLEWSLTFPFFHRNGRGIRHQPL